MTKPQVITLLIHSFLLSLLSGITFAANAAQPIQQPWSDTKYGPDGPWNAITVDVQGGSTDMKVGGYYESWMLSDNYCENSTLFPSGCSSVGLVTAPSGSLTLPGFEPNAVWTPTGAGEETTLYPISVQIPVTNPPSINNVSVGLVDSAWELRADGSSYPHTLGAWSLGAPSYNQSFGSINYSLATTALFQLGLTPSASFGLHIGAAAQGLQGSMFYGGYDRARALGDVLVATTQTTGVEAPLLSAQLLDIGIGVANGSSPFAFDSKNGLLAQGNSSITGGVLIEPSTDSPYLYLPKSTCDAIASEIPVTFQKQYGLYFWNTNDPNYSRIVSSASFLSFKIQASNLPGQSLTIKVPWKLLNLTLEEPLLTRSSSSSSASTVQYFPCRPYPGSSTGTYTLGQAFMQAAFLAVDWKPDAPPGNWFLAQAPGPGAASLPDLVALSNGVSSLQTSMAKWEDTWAGHWTVLAGNNSSSGNGGSGNNNNNHANSSKSSSGLSGGATAGVVIGSLAAAGIAAAAAFYLWRRWRAQKLRQATGVSLAPSAMAVQSNARPPPSHAHQEGGLYKYAGPDSRRYTDHFSDQNSPAPNVSPYQDQPGQMVHEMGPSEVGPQELPGEQDR